MAEADQFAVEIAAEGGICRLRCTGELDMATAPILRDALDSIESDVVLDFADLTFVDSSGVGVVLAQRARLGEGGHRLRVEGLHDLPRRTFEALGLLDDLT